MIPLYEAVVLWHTNISVLIYVCYCFNIASVLNRYNKCKHLIPNITLEPDVTCLSTFSQIIRSIRNKFDYHKNNCLDFDRLCFKEIYIDHSVDNETIKLLLFSTFYQLLYITCHLGGIKEIEIKHKAKKYINCIVYRNPN